MNAPEHVVLFKLISSNRREELEGSVIKMCTVTK